MIASYSPRSIGAGLVPAGANLKRLTVELTVEKPAKRAKSCSPRRSCRKNAGAGQVSPVRGDISQGSHQTAPWKAPDAAPTGLLLSVKARSHPTAISKFKQKNTGMPAGLSAAGQYSAG